MDFLDSFARWSDANPGFSGPLLLIIALITYGLLTLAVSAISGIVYASYRKGLSWATRGRVFSDFKYDYERAREKLWSGSCYLFMAIFALSVVSTWIFMGGNLMNSAILDPGGFAKKVGMFTGCVGGVLGIIVTIKALFKK